MPNIAGINSVGKCFSIFSIGYLMYIEIKNKIETSSIIPICFL